MYDKLILQLFNDRTSIKSPCCEDGLLEKHAYYKRGYKSLNGKDETVLTILRVKCRNETVTYREHGFICLFFIVYMNRKIPLFQHQ